MPGGSGIRLAEHCRQEGIRARIVLLTMHDEAPYLRAALSAGCRGYVLKSSAPPVLLAALRAALVGEMYIDQGMREHLDTPRSPAVTDPVELSPREREILGLLAQGLSHKQIGDRVHLSVKTVETYRTRLGKKLGLRDRADLMRYALEVGILATPSSGAADPSPDA